MFYLVKHYFCSEFRVQSSEFRVQSSENFAPLRLCEKRFNFENMKIYTKTGDKGTTALFGGTRVPKHHIRIDSYGTVDELVSWVGLLRDQEIKAKYRSILIEIQDRLFTLESLLAHDGSSLRNPCRFQLVV